MLCRSKGLQSIFGLWYKVISSTFFVNFVEKIEKFSMDSFFVHTLFIFMYYT